MTITIGIDPGATGGAVSFDGRSVQIIGRPVDGVIYAKESGAALWLENVHAFPGQGATSTFNFGKQLGMVLGAAEALGVSVSLVSPQRWQNSLLERPEGISTKEAAARFIDKMFGLEAFIIGRSRKPHLGYVDAACIAYWAAMYGGSLVPSKTKTKKRKAIIF